MLSMAILLILSFKLSIFKISALKSREIYQAGASPLIYNRFLPLVTYNGHTKKRGPTNLHSLGGPNMDLWKFSLKTTYWLSVHCDKLLNFARHILVLFVLFCIKLSTPGNFLFCCCFQKVEQWKVEQGNTRYWVKRGQKCNRANLYV